MTAMRNFELITRWGRRAAGCMALVLASSCVLIPAEAMTRLTSTPEGFGRNGDLMGTAVAVMGETAIVGSPLARPAPFLNSGLVQVFRRQAGVWQFDAFLFPDDPTPNMAFGGSVALGPELAVVGAAAATYTFEHQGEEWIQTDKETFGSVPSLSGDTLALNDGSVARIYVRSANAWVQQAELQGDLPPNDGQPPNGQFENVVGAVVDGDTAAISTVRPIDLHTTEFAVYFFTRSGGVWTRESKLDLGQLFFFFATPVVALTGDSALVVLGTAKIYVRENGTWSLQSQLDPGSDWELGFGSLAALEGGTALVGAAGDDVLGTADAGTVYVFTRSGTTWTRTARLYDELYGPGEYAAFGSSVALDGNTIFVGARGALINGVTSGKASIFEFDAGSWIRQGDVAEGNAHAGEQMGASVSLSGSKALAGAPSAGSDIPYSSGAAYIFEDSGSGWTQRARIIPASEAHVGFGKAVALDHATAAIGAANMVYVYVNEGASWNQQVRLESPGSNSFGSALALQGDLLAVGESPWGFEVPGGEVRLFERAGTDWNELPPIQPAETASADLFGWYLAMVGDTMIVGAPGTTVGIEQGAGAAYIFERDGSAWHETARLLAPIPIENDHFATAVAIAGDTAVVGSQGRDFNSTVGGAYVFAREGDQWSPAIPLLPEGISTAPSSYGTSVAISADSNVVLVGQPYTDDAADGPGAVYQFSRVGGTWMQTGVVHGIQGPSRDSFGIAMDFSESNAMIGASTEYVGGAAYIASFGDAVFANGFESVP